MKWSVMVDDVLVIETLAPTSRRLLDDIDMLS